MIKARITPKSLSREVPTNQGSGSGTRTDAIIAGEVDIANSSAEKRERTTAIGKDLKRPC